MDTKALSLIAAYAFGKEKGLTDDVEEIRTMAIDGLAQRSSVRRGYIANLFQQNGCFDEFVERHWPYGRTQRGMTKLRYYETLRRRHLDLLSGADEDESDGDDEQELTQGFALESHLRDFLAHNLAILEPGLQLYESEETTGIEFPIESGRIDILAVDGNNRHVVIELKVSQGRNKALGQLLYYMGWVDRNLPNPPCRGIIVAQEITPDLEVAVSRVSGILMYQYRVSMSVEPVAIGGPDEA